MLALFPPLSFFSSLLASLPAITGWRLLLKQQQSPTYTTCLQKRIFLGGGRNQDSQTEGQLEQQLHHSPVFPQQTMIMRI